jgi:hypothetical protein
MENFTMIPRKINCVNVNPSEEEHKDLIRRIKATKKSWEDGNPYPVGFWTKVRVWFQYDLYLVNKFRLKSFWRHTILRIPRPPLNYYQLGLLEYYKEKKRALFKRSG